MSNKSNVPLWKAVFTSLIGDITIWYDYALYAELVSVWGSLFLPPGMDKWVANMWLFGAFAAGFLMRPIGSIVIGFYGDKVGRNFALVISIASISGASLVMTFLPIYSAIGVFAPILLMIIRLVQGFALGGESGNAVFLIECITHKRITLISSLQVVSAVLGIMFSNIMVNILREIMAPTEFDSWGWRLACFFGVLLGLAGVIARSKIGDSSEYLKFLEQNSDRKMEVNHLKSLFFNYKANILIAIGVDIIEEVTIYIFVAFFGILISDYAWMRSILIVILVASTLVVAFISDYINQLNIMATGAVLLLLCSYPIIWCATYCQDMTMLWASQIVFV